MLCRVWWKVFLLNILMIVSINLTLGSKNIPCKEVGYCKCEFPNGMGVDLTLLRGTYFNISITEGERLFFYPCKNVSITNTTINATTVKNECETGVSLCLQRTVSNKTELISLGTLSESNFEWMNLGMEPRLLFHHLNRNTNIELKCGSKDPNLVLKSKFNDIYELELSSQNACVTSVTNEGHSLFSTFLLILLVLFMFYFFCGFLVLRFIRGARGWEAIPNGEFWKSVWASFKKTWVYFMNGCRHPEAYDTI